MSQSMLFLTKGSTLTQQGREYVILHLLDLDTLLVREVATGRKLTLSLSDIENAAKPTREGQDELKKPLERDLEDVSTDDWEEATRWRDAIDPLLLKSGRSLKAVTAVAEQMQVSVPTVYRRLNKFLLTGQLSSFLPPLRTGGAGKSRVSEEVELVIQDRIEHFYLTAQKPSVADTLVEIRRICSNNGLPLPSRNTLLLRLERIDKEQRVKRREGARAARQFKALKGNIPDADWPLSIVQIDHTKMPVMIVDDEHRKPISRAWVTLAIDCFSRVCPGMYISLDPPSAMSAGMCISHAILPKAKWLHKMGIADVSWPFYGVMDVLHMDNAREFRGNMLKVACAEYDIDLHLRPVKRPEYGAYIERLMGTLTQKLKTVKGATFSGPKEKGEYDAEGNACMTLDELEEWLVLMLAQYHKEFHSGIGTTPEEKWREGIQGTKTQKGRGIPALRLDEEKLRIDFMPFEERAVYDYGVVIDEVHYFADVLRPWMNSKDPDHPKEGRRFRFRRDPRDISVLYFYDPDLLRYYPIPYRDTSLPPVSIWELRAARAEAKRLKIPTSSEREVFALITRQRELEAKAALKTKSARNAQQKRTQHAKAKAQKADVLPSMNQPVTPSAPPGLKGYDPSKIRRINDD